MKEFDRRNFFKNSSIVFGLGTLASQLFARSNCKTTPPQMEGPFYPESGQSWEDFDLTGRNGNSNHSRADVFRLVGQVSTNVGGQCRPLAGARVEIWQADDKGQYKHSIDEQQNPGPRDPNFQYWGEATTNNDGKYEFITIEPGKYPGRTPHIHFRIVSADRQSSLTTQLYF